MSQRGDAWPTPWRKTGRVLVFAVVVWCPMVLLLTGITYLKKENDSLTFLSLGMFLVTIASLGYFVYLGVGYWRGWPRVGRKARFYDGSNASIVGEESVVARLAVIAPQAVAVPFLIVMPWLAFGLPEAGSFAVARGYSRLTVLSIPALILGLWLLLRIIGAVWGMRQRMLIALTEGGVVYRDEVGSYFVSWRALESVRPSAIGQIVPLGKLTRAADPESGRRSWVTRFMRVPRSIHGGRVTVNPVVPYVAICFYLRHAELRHELGTPAAAARITPEGMGEVIQEIESHGVVRREYFTTNR